MRAKPLLNFPPTEKVAIIVKFYGTQRRGATLPRFAPRLTARLRKLKSKRGPQMAVSLLAGENGSLINYN